MTTMKKRYIVSIVTSSLLLFSAKLLAQDIHFSQYAETPTAINPALAGVTYNSRAIASYKTQWSSLGNQFLTYGLTFEQTIRFKKLKNNYFAVVGNIFRDKAGDAKLSTLNPNLGFNYIQRIDKRMKLSGSMQTGFYYQTIDINNLRFDAQYDGYSYNPNFSNGEINTPRSSITSFNVGTGVNLNYVMSDRFISARTAFRFDAGIAAYHFGMGRTSFIVSSERRLTKLCGYFSGEFSIPGSINSLLPSLLITRQGTNTELIAGALFKFNIGDPSTYTSLKKNRAVSIGGQYRYKDAIIPCVLIQYNTYAIGLSYDVNISPLTPATNKRGGIEVTLRVNMAPGYGVNLGRADTKPSY